MKYTKWYVALFSVITAIIALNPPGGVVALTAFSGAMYAACFFPSVILGLHWRRGNGLAAMTSFSLGLGTLLSWRASPLGSSIHEVFPALALSLLGYIAVARLTDPPVAPDIERLFDRESQRSGRAARAGG